MGSVVNNHIEKRQTRAGDERAYIAGTRLRVQDIVEDHELHGLTPDQIAQEYPHITLAQVYAALSYYFEHRQDIQGQMKADEAFAESMERRGKPEIRIKAGGKEGDASIPS